MKTSLTKIFAILGFSILPLACGQADQAPEQTSAPMSLTGFPCEEYGLNVADTKFHCITMSGGITNNVLVELRGFNDAQRTKLKAALNFVAAEFKDYHHVSDAPLKACVNKYATKDFDAIGGLGASFPERDRKIAWALTITQFGFKYHADTKQPLIIDAFTTPSTGNSYTMAHALIGDDTVKLSTNSSYAAANFNIGVNTVALNNSSFTAQDFAGSIYHEWMHRAGWDHPNGYEGSFIKELGLCLSRDNADKGFSLSSGFEMLD